VRLLHVEHPDGGGPGVFAEVAALETWRAWEEPVPAGEFDALVLYGAATNIVDAERERWLRDELTWLKAQLDAGVPALGLCFGGQLLAAALGAPVVRAEPPEIGWHPVALTAAGAADPVLGAMGTSFDACQWHSWTFGVPAGGVLLASSPVCPQAFRHGRAWAVQFHPEVDRATLARWVDGWDKDPDAVAQGFDPARQHAELEARIDGWNARGRNLFAAFVDQL
jgi:GMP synthase-like glutamine amidotransferase